MKINVVGRKVNLRNNFKDLCEKKLARFDRIFDDDAEATVTVRVEKDRQTVEITIKQRGVVFRAEDTEREMNEALDNAISAMGRQIRKNKTRLERSKKVRADAELVDDYYEEPDEDLQVIREKRFFVKTMSVEEAILQMNLLDHEFFLFREDTTGEIHVVYRRRDGGYGLIIPEK